jgi:hypothetical protein
MATKGAKSQKRNLENDNVDTDISRKFLGEAWVARLPTFAITDPTDLTTWKQQAGAADAGLGHVRLEHNPSATRYDDIGEKNDGKDCLKEWTVNFEARWVLEKDFKGRFYIKMLGLYPGSGKLPSGDITVEVWEYSQKKTWDCRWRFGGKRDSSSNKVLFTDAVSRVPTKLTERAKPGKDGILVDLPRDNPPTSTVFSLFSALKAFPKTNEKAYEEMGPLLWEGLPPGLRPYMWMQLSASSDVKRILNKAVTKLGVPQYQAAGATNNQPRKQVSGVDFWKSWEHFYYEKILKDVRSKHHIAFTQIAEDAVAIEQWAKFHTASLEAEEDQLRYQNLQDAVKALFVLVSESNILLTDEVGDTPGKPLLHQLKTAADKIISSEDYPLGSPFSAEVTETFAYSKALIAIAFYLTLPQEGVELPPEDVCLLLLWIITKEEPASEGQNQKGGLGAYYRSGSRAAMNDVLLLRAQLEVLDPDLWARMDACCMCLDELFVPVFEHLFATYLPAAALYRLWDVLFDSCVMCYPGVGSVENKSEGARSIMITFTFGLIRRCRADLLGATSSEQIRTTLLDYMAALVNPSDVREIVVEAQRTQFGSVSGVFDPTGQFSTSGLIANTYKQNSIGEGQILQPLLEQTQELADLVGKGEPGHDIPANFIVSDGGSKYVSEHGDGVGLTTGALLNYAYPQMRWFALYSSGARIGAAESAAQPAGGGGDSMAVVRVRKVDRLYVSTTGKAMDLRSMGPKPQIRVELKSMNPGRKDQVFKTDPSPVGCKSYEWMRNNEFTFHLAPENMNDLQIELIYLNGGKEEARCHIGEHLDVPPDFANSIDSHLTMPVERLVHANGRMKPKNLWLQLKRQGSSYVYGIINVTFEVTMPASSTMTERLRSAIKQAPAGIKFGGRTWGDISPFRQLFFERYSPAETIYKQRYEDAEI